METKKRFRRTLDGPMFTSVSTNASPTAKATYNVSVHVAFQPNHARTHPATTMNDPERRNRERANFSPFPRVGLRVAPTQVRSRFRAVMLGCTVRYAGSGFDRLGHLTDSANGCF